MLTNTLATLATLLLIPIIPIYVTATTSMIHVEKCDMPELCPSSDGPWQSFKIQVQLDEAEDYRQDFAVFPSFYSGVSLAGVPTSPDSPLGASTRPNTSDSMLKYGNSTFWVDYSAGRFPAKSPIPTTLSKNLTYFFVGDSHIYTAQIGDLGLGPLAYVVSFELIYTPGIIQDLKKRSSIQSASWSMHLGSATHGPLNSLILGGYDQSRAIGDVGVFDIVLETPRMFIVDIALGVEEGASPFSTELDVEAQRDKSIWQSLGDIAADSGAAYGASVMNFSSTLPGIYLPLDNCAAIAKHLPVVWREDIEYYAWNTSDDRYQRIISSPAYLAFVLSDRSAKNITLKVPFLLLNLTLKAPYTDIPTAYFPCRPSQDNTTKLGRAVLQSAFVGITYDLNVTYVAQAPGPGVGQFLAANFPLHDKESFQAQPSASFARSWASKWTPLAETNQTASDGSGSSGGAHGLSSGAIAGIAVGVVAAFVLIGVSVWMIWKSRSKAVTKPREGERIATVSELDTANKPELESSRVLAEVDMNRERPKYELAAT